MNNINYPTLNQSMVVGAGIAALDLLAGDSIEGAVAKGMATVMLIQAPIAMNFLVDVTLALVEYRVRQVQDAYAGDGNVFYKTGMAALRVLGPLY